MKKEMLINVLQPEECRIAIVENGVLEELYVERTSHESYTGNIYKGKVVNLEPAIQAAFVDFSVGRNGFLHVSDVEPQYYGRNQPAADEPEQPAGAGAGIRGHATRAASARDRERDERRRKPRPDPLGEPLPPSLPSPPRAEDGPANAIEIETENVNASGPIDRSVAAATDPRCRGASAKAWSRTETSPPRRPRLPSLPRSSQRPRPARSRRTTSSVPSLIRGRRTSGRGWDFEPDLDRARAGARPRVGPRADPRAQSPR